MIDGFDCFYCATLLHLSNLRKHNSASGRKLYFNFRSRQLEMRPTSFYLIAEFTQLGDPGPQRSQGVMFEEAATRSQPDKKKAMPMHGLFRFCTA